MLMNFFKRCFAAGSPKLPEAPQAHAAVAPQAHAAVALALMASARSAMLPIQSQAAPPLGCTVIGARRPLVAPSGEVAAFEFHLGAAMTQRLRDRGDPMALRVHVRALIASMRLCVQGGQAAYAELPAEWLVAAPLDGDMRGIELCLSALAATGSEGHPALSDAIVAWRRSGARIGWPQYCDAVLPLNADFHLCHMPAAPEAPKRVAWVAPDLPDIEALERALARGARWAGCRVAIANTPSQTKTLSPQAQDLMNTLNKLLRDEPTSAIVGAIKRDAGLCIRLLPYLNSPGVTRGAVLESIDQAVAVLGRNALYHWISAMLVRLSPTRPAAAALRSQALARARLLESLAQVAGEPSPGSFYLMGLASLLPLLLQISLSDALASLQLPEPACLALTQRQGPWAAYLSLVEALGDSDLDSAAVLAEPLGGLDAVMAMSARAWLSS